MEKKKEIISSDAEKLWKKFREIFWALFIVHIIFYGMTVSRDMAGTSLPKIGFVMEIIVDFLMAWHVGRTSYKLSGRKSHWLNALLGFFWLWEVGIFFAYFAVRRDYNRTKGNLP